MDSQGGFGWRMLKSVVRITLTVLAVVLVGAVGVYIWMPRYRPLRNVHLGPRFNPHALKVGERAADFTLPAFEGKDFRLADHAGKVILLNFFASW